MQYGKKLYVQYGCGWSAPNEWLNFDASLTLRFERIPVIGRLYTKNEARFPENVRYGDIVKGLPLPENCADGVYASHVLEHLSYEDSYKALRNTYRILKPGGIFRLIAPDLRARAVAYLKAADDEDSEASVRFMRSTSLGIETRRRGLFGWLLDTLGRSTHLWMWDSSSMKQALIETGFVHVRDCEYGYCEDDMFEKVEDYERFYDGEIKEISLEARK